MSRLIFGSRQYNSPSRFITEMDNKFLDFQGGTIQRVYQPYHAQQYSQNEKTTKTISINSGSTIGKLVSHDELGCGVVIEDNGAILTIAFKTRGIKKVAREFIHF